MEKYIEQFTAAARNVGADVHRVKGIEGVCSYVQDRVRGPLLVSPCASLSRAGLPTLLKDRNVDVVEKDFRAHGAEAAAGVTGANFAFAETGTVALESTDESVRIATTLPEKHFVLLDPRKILASADDAVPLVEKIHKDMPQAYLAYITGPSRTADIERVLTIGVHGPAELHILLLDGLSENLMER